jgi:hypothetical protein
MMASFDQRLDQFLPPTDQAEPGQLEPMPAAEPAPILTPESTAELGEPSMDGVQLAGLSDKIIRSALTRAGKKAERELLPPSSFTPPARKAGETQADYAKRTMGEREAFRASQADPNQLPQTGTVNAKRVIPEASPELTSTVKAAVDQRRKGGYENRSGKPSPSAEERAMGMTEEVFNLMRAGTEDAAAVIGGVADALQIKTKAVTFAEIQAKAADQGIDEVFLNRLIGGDGKMAANAVETYKALEVLETSSRELDRLFKLVDSGAATDMDKLKLRQQISLHGMIQKGVKGMQTETARALAVFRIPRSGNADVVRRVLDEYGGDKSLTDLARAYLQVDTRAAKNALVEKSMMSGVKDVWMSTYINGLLSSPVSHAKNITANSLFGLYQIPERLVGSFYSNVLPDGVRGFKALVPGAAEEKIAFDEALTMIQSLRTGFGEGLELASRAWKTNQPVSDMADKVELNAREGMGETLQRIAGAEEGSLLAKGLDYYAQAITLPGRALLTEDEFFKGVLYRMELNTQITRRSKQVYREAIDAGLPEADAVARAEAEALTLFKRPPADLDEAAMEYARQGTFTADLPPGLEKLQRVFNHPALKIVVPFFKTPANIGLNVVERTPFAPLSSRWRQEIAAGGVQRDMAMAKVTLGSTILTTFALMAAEGNITGGGPKRPAERETFARTGAQPYSIKIGDQWFSYQGMEPVGALLAMAADFHEYALNEPDQGKVEQVFLGATYGLYEYLKEQPYLQGVADITKALGLSRQGGEIDGAKVVNELTKQLGGFVIGGSPAGAYSSLGAAIERIADPTKSGVRTEPDLPMGVRGFYEAFNKYRSRLPYFSQDLPEMLNLWGDPVMTAHPNPAMRGLGLVLPTRVSPEQFSAVDDALVRIGSPIGMPDKKLDGIEMDDFQYNRLLTIYGKELGAQMQIMETMMNPGFALQSLKDQQQTVQRVHSRLMEAAKMQLKQEYPGLQFKIDELNALRDANGLYYKPD